MKDVKPFTFSVISYPEHIDSTTLKETYKNLSTEGIDSIVEMILLKMAFIGTSTMGPHHLGITRWWEYDSDDYAHRYTLSEWQADNGLLLGAELDHFGQLLGSHIKSDIFTGY